MDIKQQNAVHILIVDDNKNNLFTLRSLLQTHIPDVDVIEAISGNQALRIVLAQRIDLILLDVQMPEMDGFETARLMRSWQKTQHIPIVFLTAAYKSDEFKQKGFDAGATDYLTKPIDTAQLISRIKVYLRFIRQEQEHNTKLSENNLLLQKEIEERKQIERALARLSRQHQLTLNSIGSGICEINLRGRIRFVNPAARELLGYAEEQLLHQNFHALIQPKHADGIAYPLENSPIYLAQQNLLTQHVENEVFWRSDGSCFSVDYIAAPLVEEDTSSGMVISFNDITLRKQTEEALQKAKEAAEQASLAKSQFLANMSHELRTPLNAIIGYSELLLEEAKDQARAAGKQPDEVDQVMDLKSIHGAGVNLLSLVNNVLDLSKVDAGKMDVYKETFYLPDLLTELENNTRALVQQGHNQFKLEYPEDIGTLYSDLIKVRQILLNLISNACKFTADGKIVLRLEHRQQAEQNWIVFHLSDTGIGMDETQQTRLFEAFTQADNSTTRKYGGSGLGLTLCKSFVELLGGKIEIHSALQQGSTFSVYLPNEREAGVDEWWQAEMAKSHAELARWSAETHSTTIQNNTLLLIDDDQMVHNLLQKHLQAKSYTLLHAFTGTAGLELAQQHQPAAILLDIMMPEMDGWSVLSQLKNSPELSQIPVIVLSLTEERSTGYALGATEYLTKPIDYAALLSVLEKHRLTASNKNLVMVVEDDYNNLKILEKILQHAGCEVVLAENGAVALEKIQQQTPALILLDLMMPEMDGFEFTHQLRQQPQYASIPIVVLTAKAITDADHAKLDHQVNRILQKTAHTQEQLLADIDHLLANTD